MVPVHDRVLRWPWSAAPAVLLVMIVVVLSAHGVRGQGGCTLCPDRESPLNLGVILENITAYLREEDDVGSVVIDSWPGDTPSCFEVEGVIRSVLGDDADENSNVCTALRNSPLPALCGCPGVTACTLCPAGEIPSNFEAVADGFFDFIGIEIDDEDDGTTKTNITTDANTCQYVARTIASTVTSVEVCNRIRTSSYPLLCGCPDIDTCTLCPDGDDITILDAVLRGTGDLFLGSGNSGSSGSGRGGGNDGDGKTGAEGRIFGGGIFGGGNRNKDDGDGDGHAPSNMTCSEASDTIGRYVQANTTMCTTLQDSYMPFACGCPNVVSCALCPDGSDPTLVDEIAEGFGNIMGGVLVTTVDGDDDDDGSGSFGIEMNPTCSRAVDVLSSAVRDGSTACDFLHESPIPRLCGCPGFETTGGNGNATIIDDDGNDNGDDGNNTTTATNDDDEGDEDGTKTSCTLCPGGEDPANGDNLIPPEISDALGMDGFFSNLITPDCRRGADLIANLDRDSTACRAIESSSIDEICGCPPSATVNGTNTNTTSTDDDDDDDDDTTGGDSSSSSSTNTTTTDTVNATQKGDEVNDDGDGATKPPTMAPTMAPAGISPTTNLGTMMPTPSTMTMTTETNMTNSVSNDTDPTSGGIDAPSSMMRMMKGPMVFTITLSSTVSLLLFSAVC